MREREIEKHKFKTIQKKPLRASTEFNFISVLRPATNARNIGIFHTHNNNRAKLSTQDEQFHVFDSRYI